LQECIARAFFTSNPVSDRVTHPVSHRVSHRFFFADGFPIMPPAQNLALFPMLALYLPILIFIVFSTLMACGILVGSKILSKILKTDQPSPEKLSPFECGFPEFEDARSKFDVKFYLLAILFIVFDLEVAFLFPWAVIFTQVGWYGFFAMGLFLLILILGFVVEWKKGALEWE